MRTNPNTNAAGIGGAIGVLIAWALGHWHVHLSAEDGAAISTAVAALVLYIGRDGLSGIYRAFWRGRQAPSSPPPSPPGP